MQFLFGEIYIFTFLHQLRFPPLKIYIHVYFTKKNLQQCIYVSFMKFAPGTFQGPEGYRIRFEIFFTVTFRHLQMDKSDGDTMAAKREAVARAERAFKLFDKDNDGYITKDEFQKISKKLSKEQVTRKWRKANF